MSSLNLTLGINAFKESFFSSNTVISTRNASSKCNTLDQGRPNHCPKGKIKLISDFLCALGTFLKSNLFCKNKSKTSYIQFSRLHAVYQPSAMTWFSKVI